MQKFLCKIGCALQRELTNMLILAVWGLYLFALLGCRATLCIPYVSV